VAGRTARLFVQAAWSRVADMMSDADRGVRAAVAAYLADHPAAEVFGALTEALHAEQNPVVLTGLRKAIRAAEKAGANPYRVS
jgi:hypothetical protein